MSGCGATISKRSSAAIHAASCWVSSTWRRISAWYASIPSRRSPNHSLRARKRRPRGTCQSRRSGGRPGGPGGGAQVLGQDAQRAEQGGAVGRPVQVAVEVDAHPLVRVGAVAVGQLESVVDPAVLRDEGGDPRHRRIDVQPGAGVAADRGDLRRRVEGHRRRRAARRAHEERRQSGGTIGRDERSQRLGDHRELGVVVDDADRVAADAGDAQRLLDARVGVRRGVGDEPGRVAVVVDGAAGRPPARRQARRRASPRSPSPG